MSLAFLSRRFPFLLLVTPLVIAGCVANAPVAPTAAGPSGCPGGKGSNHPDLPIICVNDRLSVLTVDPDRAYVNDVDSTDKRTPVAIHWFTRSGGRNLQIAFSDPSCVKNLSCDGRGHCRAVTNPVTAQKTCKYDVWTDVHPKLDPYVIVTPCCVGQVLEP